MNFINSSFRALLRLPSNDEAAAAPEVSESNPAGTAQEDEDSSQEEEQKDTANSNAPSSLNDPALSFLADFLDKRIEDLNKKVDNVMKEIREEVQDSTQIRSQGIPGLSTILNSSSNESTTSEPGMLNLSKDIDGSLIDLSLNLWSSRYLNTKDTAFSKAKKQESVFSEEVTKQKHFNLKESRFYGLKRVVEDKLKSIDAIELTTFDKVSMANPGSSITLEMVLKRSKEVWNETEMAAADAELYSENVQIERKLKRHNNHHKSQTLGLFLLSALSTEARNTMEANYKDSYMVSFGGTRTIDGLLFLHFLYKEIKPPSDLIEMELRDELGALSASKYKHDAVKTLDRYCQLIEALGHEGALIDEKQRRAVIYRAMRSVVVTKFHDFVDLVQREDRLAQQKLPPKSSSELISLFREEQRTLMKQGMYLVPGGDSKNDGNEGNTKFISLATNAGGANNSNSNKQSNQQGGQSGKGGSQDQKNNAQQQDSKKYPNR